MLLSLLAAASLSALDFHPLPNTLSQIEALKRLYTATNGATWEEKMNEGWMKVERGLGSECAWDGVECDPEMNVIGIELSTRGLRGTLPPEMVIKTLKYLHVDDNAMLSGTVSADLRRMDDLQTLFLRRTKLSGTLPDELITSLRTLREFTYGKTRISGTLSPSAFGLAGARGLEALQIEYNSLSGTLAPFLLQNLQVFKYLRSNNNFISGTLPPQFGSMSQLEQIEMDATLLSGTLPPVVSPSVAHLELDRTPLTGTIPNSFAILTDLEHLSNMATHPSSQTSITFLIWQLTHSPS